MLYDMMETTPATAGQVAPSARSTSYCGEDAVETPRSAAVVNVATILNPFIVLASSAIPGRKTPSSADFRTVSSHVRFCVDRGV
jgi:hypothetical protein